MEYCGWVPTVTGHLSFNTIGTSSFPVKSQQLRYGKSAICLQTRDLLDVIIPFLSDNDVGRYFRECIANYFIGISGKFTFVSLVSYEDDECLTGKIYLLANSKCSGKIQDIKKALSFDDCDAAQYATSYKLVSEICDTHSMKLAEICLERGGKLLIETNLKNENSDSNSKALEVDFVLANQFYYFFKDIAHVHQHHEPNHDAITELTVVKKDEKDQWIENIQSDLYRAVIRYKRFRNEKALFRASGILAYAKSFDVNYGKKFAKRREFNVEQLEQSLSVSRAEIHHFDQKKLAKIESIRNVFFGLFGFLISASFLLRMGPKIDPIEIHPWLSSGTQLVASKPIQVVGIIFFISMVFSYFSHNSDPAENKFPRTILRLWQGYRMRNFMITNIIITVFLSVVCYYMLFYGLFAP